MVEKLDSGDYRCERCGRVISNYKKAKEHQRLCGLENLSGYLSDVQNVWNLDIPEMEKPESFQLKLGESFIGKCPNCGCKITSKDRIEGRKYLYECRKCENVVRDQD